VREVGDRGRESKIHTERLQKTSKERKGSEEAREELGIANRIAGGGKSKKGTIYT